MAKAVPGRVIVRPSRVFVLRSSRSPSGGGLGGAVAQTRPKRLRKRSPFAWSPSIVYPPSCRAGGAGGKGAEVFEARLAAVRPVLPVVCLEVGLPLAPREAAGVVVAAFEQTAERLGHCASRAADAERKAVSLDLRDQLGVPAESAGRLGGDHRAVAHFRAAGGVGGERGGVDVHDDARADARSAGRRARVGVESSCGQVDQCFDTRRTRGLDSHGQRLQCGLFGA